MFVRLLVDQRASCGCVRPLRSHRALCSRPRGCALRSHSYDHTAHSAQFSNLDGRLVHRAAPSVSKLLATIARRDRMVDATRLRHASQPRLQLAHRSHRVLSCRTIMTTHLTRSLAAGSRTRSLCSCRARPFERWAAWLLRSRTGRAAAAHRCTRRRPTAGASGCAPARGHRRALAAWAGLRR